MALALLGRGSLHPLTTWGENLGVRAYPEAVRPCKLPRPKRASHLKVVLLCRNGENHDFRPRPAIFFQ